MHQAKLDSFTEFYQYGLQAIVNADQRKPTWYELLYRPGNNVTDVEYLFANMTDGEKIEFDTNLLINLPQIQKRHGAITLSININPVSLESSEFLNLLKHLMKMCLIDCSKLCIEIVESGQLEALNIQALQTLERFSTLGGKLALDDFGTGNTHWELIHKGLVDIIKIAAHKHQDHNELLLGALMDFAYRLDLITVIEGVETHNDLEIAQAFGANYYQGWYFNQWNNDNSKRWM